LKHVLRALLVLITTLILLLVAGFVVLRTSLPQVTGSITLPRLTGEVEVIRDEFGIPHIHAQTQEDAYYALGFVHAQDRLWQMEFQRLVGNGRLAEVVGEEGLDTDRFIRTLGVRQAATQALDYLSPKTLGVLQAYSDGVNAFLASRKGLLPPEFLLLQHEPEPWQPVDILVWSKMMAWDLAGNQGTELLRARLARELHPEQLADLWAPWSREVPLTLPDLREPLEDIDLDGLAAVLHPRLSKDAGSNAWALSGRFTASGKPILANDPHLGLQSPSLWYLAHLNAPGLNVIGATLPGTPTVLLGRNDRIAWGFTNTGTDVQDLFIEEVSSHDPTMYRTPDGFENFLIRNETIRVKGSEDIVLRVRETRHGPVISDLGGAAGRVADSSAAAGTQFVLALQWTALQGDDRTVQAVLNLGTAGDWTQFTRALRDFHNPQQNIMYADVNGNIGFYAAGRVPVRAAGDGRVPVPGWSGTYDWTGSIPFEELPHDYNPRSGRFINANQAIVDDSYPYLLTPDWSEPYRANRITELLDSLRLHSLETSARIQSDQVSLMARDFIPWLLDLELATETERNAQALLFGWDGLMSAESAAPLILAAWQREFQVLLLGDALGPLFEAYAGHRPRFLLRVLEERADWCTAAAPAAADPCTQVATRAFSNAVSWLSDLFGARPHDWRWDSLHHASQPHAVLDGTPLAPFFSLSSPTGGDAFTVNAAHFSMFSASAPFRQTEGPGYRSIVDLADPDGSRFIHSTGQSGNPLSAHYRDFLPRWLSNDGVPMTMDREDYARGGSELRLLPRR
jgi:penicillin amidase